MADFHNRSQGALVFPDGTEVSPGEKVSISQGDQDHPAIAHWISEGWLEASSSKPSKKPTAEK